MLRIITWIFKDRMLTQLVWEIFHRLHKMKTMVDITQVISIQDNKKFKLSLSNFISKTICLEIK